MPLYADVLLPLALEGTLTYTVPPQLAERLQVGCRVVVPLGVRKFYSAVVVRLHGETPRAGYVLKGVAGLVDDSPIVSERQVSFWEWLARYYMCTPGEVMKAALPAGLKLESEMQVLRNADFDAPGDLSARDAEVLGCLSAETPKRIDALQKEVGGADVLPAVRRLVERGAAIVEERMVRGFRPRTETHVRLAAPYRSEAALNALFAALKRTPKQEALLLSYLEQAGAGAALALGNEAVLAEVAKRDLLSRSGCSEAVLAALRTKGVLETYPYEVGRLGRAAAPLPEALEKQLSAEQERALAEIHRAFEHKDCCLLHGVTASGKTEVYTRLIRETLAQGKQVLYLLPEIALTTQIMQRLSRVFGPEMGIYHSKFPDAERVELYRKQACGDTPYGLVLGARSALFLPFRDLGLIIVDEEHEPSYKQHEPAPRYNARDAAQVLARLWGAKVLLGTATPSLESYHNALAGRYGLVTMATRYGGVELPEIIVEDVAELQRKKLMPTPFSPRLTEEVRAALQGGEQVILFQNRRGYSPVLECRSCGWTPRCTRCDVPLTFHQREGRVVCHYCGASYPVPARCPECGGTELRDVGYGTEKIEAAVRAVFPEARTARLDLDTTRSRTGYDAILGDFAAGRTDILIGTQMVTKGLDFDRVRVVGILNADQHLNQPDFRAYERAYQMMSQVAGRAGRRGRRGIVILQTRQPDLPVVESIVQSDYGAFYAEQSAEREAFLYPPYARVIYIYVKHRDERTCAAAADTLAELLRPHFAPECLLGPERPAVGRVQLQYIRKILLKVTPELPASGVRRTLRACRAAVLADARFRAVNVYFDVDPL